MGPVTRDVVVVGGGLVGCLAARALARAGASVALVERAGELCREASWAAAGMLSPQMEAIEGILVEGSPGVGGDVMLDLCIAGRDGYPAFVREIEAETGASVHYRTDGTLVLTADGTEAETLATRAADQRARGLRAEWLDAPAARALEPAIAANAIGAVHLPDDHQVDNIALAGAAAAALAQQRVDVRTGASAESLLVEAGRAAGVVVAGGRLAAGAVVLAAGAWSGRVAGVPSRVPVRPVKGQMAALLPPDPPFRRTVGARGVYCVPRDDGRVLVGATVEEAGFDKRVDEASTDALLAAAAAVIPALAGVPVVARWAGLRPGTADDLPVLGPDPEIEGLVWATGHYRNGILLAPITADAVAALLRGEAPLVDLAPFAPGRAGLFDG